MKNISLLLSMMVVASLASAAPLSIPHSFEAGKTAVANDVNDNFIAIENKVNELDLSVDALSQSKSVGKSAENPGASCNQLKNGNTSLTSGIYWLKTPAALDSFRVYCDMSTDGGGWTLVWSNLRGGSAKVFTKLAWGAAINTLPRYKGEPSKDLESFEVYTGLKHWTLLAPTGELRYAWSFDYGEGISQHYRVPFALDADNNYTITFEQSNGIGSSVPGIVLSSNGLPFSTYDNDNDLSASHCARAYSDAPWWYGACWSGSIIGGGEWGGTFANGGGISNGTTNIVDVVGYVNAAYWVGSIASWGTVDGAGGGNGWIFVR